MFFELKDKEIIVIDDLSSENNLKILRKYINSIDKKHNVRLIENSEKYFLGQIRNIAISLSKGHWIFLLMIIMILLQKNLLIF
ncbi:MAG: glycosyltransferase [Mycoplasmataceae bacterium]|nr:glycosyltransferase [Mycoplasmataceae bacterium]